MDMLPGQSHSLFQRRCHASVSAVAEMQKGLGEKWTRTWSSWKWYQGERRPLSGTHRRHSPFCYRLNSSPGFTFRTDVAFSVSWTRGLISVLTLSLVCIAGARRSPTPRPTFLHPFSESLYDRAYGLYTRQDNRARKNKTGEKDKVTVKLS